MADGFMFGMVCCCVPSGPFDFYFDVNRGVGVPTVQDSELFYRYPWVFPEGVVAGTYTSLDAGWQIDMNSEADAGLYEGTGKLTLTSNTADYDRVWSILQDVDDHPDGDASPDNLLANWPSSDWTQSGDADIVERDLVLNNTDTDVDVTAYDSISLTSGDYELIIRVEKGDIEWLRVHSSGGLDPSFSCYIEGQSGLTAPTVGTTSGCTASVVDRGDDTYYVKILFTAATGTSGQINLTAVSADADTNYTGNEDDAITIHYAFMRKLTGSGLNGHALSVVNARAESDLAFYMPQYIDFINDDPWYPTAVVYGYDSAYYLGFLDRHQLLENVASASNFGGVHTLDDPSVVGVRMNPRSLGNIAGKKAQVSGSSSQFAGYDFFGVGSGNFIDAFTVWNVDDSTPPFDKWGFASTELWGEVEWNRLQASYDIDTSAVNDSENGEVDITYGSITHVPLHPVWIVPPRSYPYVITVQQPKGDWTHESSIGNPTNEYWGASGSQYFVWFERSVTETVGVYMGQVIEADRSFKIGDTDFFFETFDHDVGPFPMLSGSIDGGTIFELSVTKDRLYRHTFSSALRVELAQPAIYNCWCSATWADIQRGDGSVLLGAAIVNYGQIDTITLVGTTDFIPEEEYQSWENHGGSTLPWANWLDEYWTYHPNTDHPSEVVTTKTFITVRINGHTMLTEETFRDEDHGYSSGAYGVYCWATGMHACKQPASSVPGSPPPYLFAWFEQQWTTEPTAEDPGVPGPWRLRLTSSTGTDWWTLDSLPYDEGVPTPEPMIVASSDQGVYIKGFLLFDDRIPEANGHQHIAWFLSYEKNEDGKPKYQGPSGQWLESDFSEIDPIGGGIDMSDQRLHWWDCVKNSAQVRLSPRAADFGIRTTTLYVP